MAERKDHIGLSMSALIVTLGIVYGDIGTSPLYVFKAMFSFGNFLVDENLIRGAVSAIFWTLTLQTTIKYVLITLKADNNGEGGIFSLYALIKRTMRSKKFYIVAIIGGATLMADGMITCGITVTSAIEGLKMTGYDIPVVPLVLIIISLLFFFQRHGTKKIGKSFGPIMLVWFSLLAIVGLSQIAYYPQIITSLNPYYAFNLLYNYPGSFVLLGAIFLCTTGAEALYADLGHCGIKNIRISWIFVKAALVLNYLGQAAYLVRNGSHVKMDENPFFAVMPSWLLIPSIIIATMAAIIASQALISGIYTLVHEAIALRFFPRLKIRYTSDIKGQVFVPKANFVLWLGSCFVVLFFQESGRMEAAYGLAITITMLMTTILMSEYLWQKKHLNAVWILLFLLVYLTIEGAFLISNIHKFSHGGWFTILISSILAALMFCWYNGSRLIKSFTRYSDIKKYLPVIKDISKDTGIAKKASNLVFFTNTANPEVIDNRIIYSIIYQTPKRADRYWFIHLEEVDSPYICEYSVRTVEKDVIYRINLRLGFRIAPRVNQYFRQILDDLQRDGVIDNTSTYDSLNKYQYKADYKFILVKRVRNVEIELPYSKSLILSVYYWLKKIQIDDMFANGLNSGTAEYEYVPLSMLDKTTTANKIVNIDKQV